MIPQIAGEDELAAANALNGTIENLTVITGPAIGAGLLALGSPGIVFVDQRRELRPVGAARRRG